MPERRLIAKLSVSVFTRYYSPDYVYNWNGSVLNVYDNNETVTAVALMMTFGKQIVFKNGFTIDWFGSFGYSYRSDGDGGFSYGFIAGGEEVPLAVSTGFKFGYAFGEKTSKAVD
jgi:hypothetical protein